MKKSEFELMRIYASVEGVSVNDEKIQRIPLEMHTNHGDILTYELELGDSVVKNELHYVPLYRRLNEEERLLKEVLVFEDEAKIMPNEQLPYKAVVKPRKDVVTPETWHEYRTKAVKRYTSYGAVAAGLTAGAVMSVYKWRQKHPR